MSAFQTAPVFIPNPNFKRGDTFHDASPTTIATPYLGILPATTSPFTPPHWSSTTSEFNAGRPTTTEAPAVDGFFLQDPHSSSPSSHDDSDLDMSESDSEATDEEDWEAMGSEVLRAKPSSSFASGYVGSPNVGRSFGFAGSPNVATSYGTSPSPWTAKWEQPKPARKVVGMGMSVGTRTGNGRSGLSGLSSSMVPSGPSGLSAMAMAEDERARKEREAVEALVSLRSI